MNNEIKEILDRLERIDHKEYIAFEFADSATFDEMARCFEERKKMADYITDLEQEKDDYKSRNEKAIEYIRENKDKYYQDWGEDDGSYDTYLGEYEIDKVLSILQGVNNENIDKQ